MSNKHRLMKIVEIEKNYHKHRERLLSIQHINSRQKQYVSSLAPSPASAAYKQSRLKADLFAYKSRTKDIQRENKILIQHIQKQHICKKREKIGSEVQRSSSSYSIRTSSSRINMRSQNKRLLQKISNTKSIYSKFRQEKKTKKDSKQTSKQEIINLLVNQFGVKPTVIFPVLKPRRNSALYPKFK